MNLEDEVKNTTLRIDELGEEVVEVRKELEAALGRLKPMEAVMRARCEHEIALQLLTAMAHGRGELSYAEMTGMKEVAYYGATALCDETAKRLEKARTSESPK